MIYYLRSKFYKIKLLISVNTNRRYDRLLIDWKKIGLFAAGTFFGTAGIKLLSSKDAKKAYAQGTAAVLRMKECVMDTVSCVQENASDILAEAKDINEERAAKEEAANIEE